MAERVVGKIVLVRHGATEWTRNGRHTGLTDLPLDEGGEASARKLAVRLSELHIETAFSSPLRRALDTARLSGFADAVILDDLVEWDYGEYEGLTTAEIRKQRPHWSIFADGCPGGEVASEVAARCRRVLDQIRVAPEVPGAVALFAHGHLLRVLAATYLGLDPSAGRLFPLDVASISILGFEHEYRTLRRWNT